MFLFYEQLLFATSGVKVAHASSSFITYMMPNVTKQSDLKSYLYEFLERISPVKGAKLRRNQCFPGVIEA